MRLKNVLSVFLVLSVFRSSRLERPLMRPCQDEHGLLRDCSIMGIDVRDRRSLKVVLAGCLTDAGLALHCSRVFISAHSLTCRMHRGRVENLDSESEKYGMKCRLGVHESIHVPTFFLCCPSLHQS